MKSSTNSSQRQKGWETDSSLVLEWKPKSLHALLQDEQNELEYLEAEAERLLDIFKPIGKKKSFAPTEPISVDEASFHDIRDWFPTDIREGEMFQSLDDQDYSRIDEVAFSLHGSEVPNKPLDPEQLSTELEHDRVLTDIEQVYQQRLAEAQRKADLILANAVTEREKIFQAAHQEGVEAGKKEMNTAVESSKQLLEELSQWREQMFEQSEQEVLDLLKDVAHAIFGEGYLFNKEKAQQAFSNIMVNARLLGDLRVYVNPEDARKLDPSWREYQVLVSGQKIQILPTDGVTPGGCYIEGMRGSVDARVETQLREILNGLTAEDQQSDEDGDQ